LHDRADVTVGYIHNHIIKMVLQSNVNTTHLR